MKILNRPLNLSDADIYTKCSYDHNREREDHLYLTGLFDYPDWPSSPGLLGGLIKSWTPLGLSCPMNGGLLNLLGLVVRSHFGKTNAGLDWTRSPVPPSPGNQTSPEFTL